MRDPYNWVEVTNPRSGYHSIATPRTKAEALRLIAHVNEKDRKELEAAFEEGYRIGGMKFGLQFIQDRAAEWRTSSQYVPSKKS